VHVRLAPTVGGRRLNPAGGPRSRIPPLLAALGACWLTGACARPASDVTFEWALRPHPPVAGPAVLTVRVLDAARRPVRGATLRVEGHMSHPGMAPVLATARDGEEGVYVADLRFTMPGDWILLVSGSLSNGARVQHRINVPGVGSAG